MHFNLLAALLGVCNDQSASCHEWAKAGECQKREARHLCPVSCKMCKGGTASCHDQHQECMEWMKAGDCTSQPYQMLRKCPVSCGICSPVCEDGEPEKKHPAQKRGESHCDFRARLGHCEGSNAESMMRDCPVACKICRLKPADTLGDCAAKAADGACQKDALNLLRSCPLACGLRRLDGDNPMPAPAPSTAPAATPAAARKTVKGLEAFCHDFDPNACGSWAAAGQVRLPGHFGCIPASPATDPCAPASESPPPPPLSARRTPILCCAAAARVAGSPARPSARTTIARALHGLQTGSATRIQSACACRAHARAAFAMAWQLQAHKRCKGKVNLPRGGTLPRGLANPSAISERDLGTATGAVRRA